LKKVLIIRFSSIGDIVLTTPVIRCIKKSFPDAEVHYVTKYVFKDVLVHNPYIHQLHTFLSDSSEVIRALKKEQFDLVVDLHRNIRSWKLKQAIAAPSLSFNKLNIKKWLAVRLKSKTILPPIHIVERYLATVLPMGVKNDGLGLDYFISEEDKVNLKEKFNVKDAFTVVVVGGSYYTKQIPVNKLLEIVSKSKQAIILLGGKSDVVIANEVVKTFPTVINACGVLSLNQSASVIEQSSLVITSDTGLMHMAAAFGKKIVSLWGNTIPEFGMNPYKAHPKSVQLEVNDLNCRPCSKLGYNACPRKHFKCMNAIEISEEVINDVSL
jgi:ADP-heptose:LPS heptosyltransferase